MSLSAIIDALIAAGCSPEQIGAAVRAHETEVESKKHERRAKDAERKRRSRLSANVRVTSCDNAGHSVTDADSGGHGVTSLPDKEKSPTPPKEINPSHTSLRSELSSARAEEIFETEFWPAYPKRDGSNPKQPAKAKFVAHVKSGIDPAKIVAGVKAYSIFMANDEPRFVMQATRFLNQKCWQDDYSVRAQGPPKPKQDTWADTADWFLRGEDDDGSRREESSHEVVELSREDWTRA